jgi:hypothetical protein
VGWARGGDFRPEHIMLNNDSMHGQTVNISVDVSALGDQGNFYIYMLCEDADDWYRLNFSQVASAAFVKFEKRIGGTITQIGDSVHAANLGNGSDLRNWYLTTNPDGTLTFTQDGILLLSAQQALQLESGLIGLGGWARTPVWENFNFTTVVPEPATLGLLALGGLAMFRRRPSTTV